LAKPSRTIWLHGGSGLSYLKREHFYSPTRLYPLVPAKAGTQRYMPASAGICGKWITA
jgi:hypothetical protein